jgi:type VI secretion system Hcp family effector
MDRLLNKSVAIAVVALALCLALTAQTQPAAGKFGLPAAKPATAPAIPVTSTAVAVPTSAPAAQASAPMSAAAKNILPGIAIKKVYVTITGAKQGNIGKMEVSKFQFQPNSLRDPATGLPTGKTSIAPIICSKQWDAASVHLLDALDTNETLSTVLFEFIGADARSGLESAVYSVKLTNATIASIHQNVDTTVVGAPLEEVTFTYKKIDFTDVKSNQTATDDWK